jgi:hypothetical protein
VIQETAWEVVATRPLTGVTSTDPLRVATPWLPAAVVGEAYDARLEPAFGTGPYTWRLAGGALPDGVTLDAAGHLTGSATTAGNFSVTVEVKDANGAAAQRALNLPAVPDSAPEVVTAALPALHQGANLDTLLEARGGNGYLAWKLARGKLPPGLTLHRNGRIRGAPAQPGTWPFTVHVEDADRTTPDSATREITATVGPPVTPVILSPETTTPVKVDGQLDDPCWRDIEGRLLEAGKLVSGAAPNNTVRFATAWRPYHLFVAIIVKDDAVRPGDAVEVFVDGANNREKIYNVDDRHLVITPAGKFTVPGAAAEHFQVAAAPIAGGYVIEVDLSQHNLREPIRANGVMGLDIANTDDDGQGPRCQTVWQGTKDNATDPSGFGTVVFCPHQSEGKQ